MLNLHHIHKKIDSSMVLNNVSFNLKKGEIVCVIGPSGAGKTSLLRAASLIELPDSGTWSLDDQTYVFPLQTKPIFHPPYPKLTVVFQQLFIWPHLRIKESILLPQKGPYDAAYFEQIATLLGLHSFLDRFPNQISLGQKQRAAIARALLLKPDYLLLDEITSALDVEQTYLILNHLRTISDQGIGILFATHSLQHACKIANRILFLEQGQILEEGDQYLLNNPQTDRLKRFLEMY